MDDRHVGGRKKRQIAFVPVISFSVFKLRAAALGLVGALCIILMSCSAYRPNYLSDQLQAVNAVENFYFHLDVKRYTLDSLDDIVSDDFLVFESGQVMDRGQFHRYLSHTDDSVEPLSLTRWEQSDFNISSDERMIHASYRNVGRFEHGTSMVVEIEWLESALFIRTSNGLTLKFLNVNLVSKTIN